MRFYPGVRPGDLTMDQWNNLMIQLPGILAQEQGHQDTRADLGRMTRRIRENDGGMDVHRVRRSLGC